VKVLLLSAYAAQSHVYWHENLALMFADWDWHILTLPPRHFSWRVRGNPLYWSLQERELLDAEYDLLIATSMVDLATLRGLVPRLASVPTVLYFHENQFEYPQIERNNNLLEAQMVSLYSSLAADQIVFNSAYNKNSFLHGCDALLKRLPDRVPAGVVAALGAKSQVIPVPLKPGFEREEPDATAGKLLRLLWVGRFEYDKGGDQLLYGLRALERRGLPYELAVVGQQFRNSPDAFACIETEFKHRLVQFGYIESREEYQKMLAAADIVLSTALHEFQGLAVLEAIAAGCLPAVPDRLVYPELIPAGNCYPSYPDDPEREGRGAAALIVALARQLEQGTAELPEVSMFKMEALKPQYRALFASLSPRAQ